MCCTRSTAANLLFRPTEMALYVEFGMYEVDSDRWKSSMVLEGAKLKPKCGWNLIKLNWKRFASILAYPPPPQGPYTAPPPAGYPMQDGHGYPQQAPPPVETKDRGDGFWKGCCAALCCCCVLDMCF
ncbi:hypothetical protein HHK36_000682 [Tetracentron sinense]|uniref:Cysteine-rich transmembrane domain-containing protein n=1 Tax=Tetracentron sinense TaxID=13715 RepID=A0A835DRB9_TETSI|nr:hypothetical protein HHK36_000682 [Tetracentron sinense]